MLSERLVGVAGPLVRFARTRIFLDLDEIVERIPERGRLLDVGCWIGLLTYEIAKRRPNLDILAIDIEANSVSSARVNSALPNIRYEARPLQELHERFDCILFSDVVHHIPPDHAREMLAHCENLVTPGGYILVKDIAMTGGGVCRFIDRYVVRSYPIHLRDPDDYGDLLPPHYDVFERTSKYRFPFPNYYLRIRPQGSRSRGVEGAEAGT